MDKHLSSLQLMYGDTNLEHSEEEALFSGGNVNRSTCMRVGGGIGGRSSMARRR